MSPTEKLLAEVREDVRNTHMSNDVGPRNSRLVEKLDRLVRIVECQHKYLKRELDVWSDFEAEECLDKCNRIAAGSEDT